MEVAVFHSKSFDMKCLTEALERRESEEEKKAIKFRFLEARLCEVTAELAHDAKAVCAFVNDDLSAPVIDKLADLGIKCIALRCAGFDRCDINRANKRGICVMRVPAYSPHAVAEHAWALILSLSRKIPRAVSRTREFNFSLDTSLLGMELNGRKLGVIGAGKIGQIVATIGKGFGMEVLCYDKFPDPEFKENGGVTFVDDVDDVFLQADVVSLHVPLLPSTKFIINKRTLEMMKPTSLLVNTSRGGLIDTQALVEAVRTHSIAGVALDVVYGEEDFIFSDKSDDNILNESLARLSTYRQAIVTGHMAFFSDVALTNIGDTTVENLLGMAGMLVDDDLEQAKELGVESKMKEYFNEKNMLTRSFHEKGSQKLSSKLI